MNYLTSLLLYMMFFDTVAHTRTQQLPIIQWHIAGNLPASAAQPVPLGFAGPVTGVTNDILLIAGGANFPDGMPWEGGKKKYYDDVYAYRWQKDKLVRLPAVHKLAAPIAYAATCSTPRGVFYAGGENDNGLSDKAFLLQWSPVFNKITTEHLPALPVAISNAGAAVYNNTVYIAGGEMAGAVSARLFCLSLNNAGAGWRELPPVPVPVSHMVMIASDNDLCIFGGRRKNNNGISDLYATVYSFNTRRLTWTQKKSLPFSLTAGTGIALSNTQVLLFGGDSGNEFHQAELLAAEIKAAVNDTVKQRLIQQKGLMQASHPGFTKEIWCYDLHTNECRDAGQLPFPAQVTTTAIRWGGHVIIPGGEVRAGVRTPAIVAGTINPNYK